MLVECKKKIKVQWQEIKGVRDEIKSKWKKMTKGNEKGFKCMPACGNLSIFVLIFACKGGFSHTFCNFFFLHIWINSFENV